MLSTTEDVWTLGRIGRGGVAQGTPRIGVGPREEKTGYQQEHWEAMGINSRGDGGDPLHQPGESASRGMWRPEAGFQEAVGLGLCALDGRHPPGEELYQGGSIEVQNVTSDVGEDRETRQGEDRPLRERPSPPSPGESHHTTSGRLANNL